MRKINITISALSPFDMEFDYRPQISELENIQSALSRAMELVSKEAANNSDNEDTKKPVYEAIFELNDGKKYLGYSSEADMQINGKFAHRSATKELKGLVAVRVDDIAHFRFTPL
ncbi:hypothetical protein [Buttiauxella noackiae]|uniref:hypothetical protein n=1 Tax=Buttiauxella noackiae TaxID=82992 RepID=UPI0028D6FF0F|nr:hypothetical protein [Buttiauxella noackiae]